MAIETSRYLDPNWKAKEEAASLSASLLEAKDTNPAEEAKRAKLAKTLNVSPTTLPEDAEARAKLDKLHPELYAATSPYTTKFLADKANAKIVGLDEVPVAAKLESALTRRVPLDEQWAKQRKQKESFTAENMQRFISNYAQLGLQPTEAKAELERLRAEGYDLNEYFKGNREPVGKTDFAMADRATVLQDKERATRKAKYYDDMNVAQRTYTDVKDAAAQVVPGIGKGLASAYLGSDTSNRTDWLGNKAEDWIAKATEIEQEYRAGGADDTAVSTGQSLGYSLATILPTVTMGAPGVAMSAAMMYRGSTRDFMSDLREEYSARHGEVSDAQWITLAQQVDSQVIKHGLWETATETASNLIFLRILKGVFGTATARGVVPRAVSKAKGALDILGKAGKVATLDQGPEMLTETVTRQGQFNASVQARNILGLNTEGTQEREWTSTKDLTKSFMDVRDIVFFQTLAMGGLGSAAVVGRRALGGLAGMDGGVKTRMESQAYEASLKAEKDYANTFTDAFKAQTRAAIAAEDYADTTRAVELYTSLTEAQDVAANSELLKNSPEVFHDFINTMAEDGHLPEVYVSKVRLLQALQAEGVSLAQLGTVLPDVVEQLSGATEVDVRISTPDYLTHIATNPSGVALLPEMKSTAGGPTFTEAQALYQKETEEFSTLVNKIATKNADVMTEQEFNTAKQEEAKQPIQTAEIPTAEGTAEEPPAEMLPATYAEYVANHENKTEAHRQDVAKVHDTIYEQFKKTGRYTKPVARAYAQGQVAFYTAMAKIAGVSPSELYAKYPLKTEAISNWPKGEYLNQNDNATLDDFKKESVENILEKDNWVILTAENPGANKLSDEENATRMGKLIAQLDAEGAYYVRVDGKYGRDEKSVILFNTTPERALALGREYDQESVLTRDGYIFQDGSRTPTTGEVEVHETAPKDYFTTMPDGTMFTIGLDFDTRLQPGEQYNPTEKIGAGVAQEETPAFKKWFGKSQVVDEYGEPMVVYHNSPSKGITTFNPSASGNLGAGIYFTSDEGLAKDYGEEQYAVYVALANPWTPLLDWTSEAVYEEDFDSPSVGAVLELPNGRELLERARDSHDGMFDKTLQDTLKKLGYDGIFAEHITGGFEIVAFEPSQIKSATGNNGEFNASDANILHQGGKLGQVAIRGTHMSTVYRPMLSGGFYGTGAKGAEAERLRTSKDARIKKRLYFYVDEGKGVFPEHGVGTVPHVVTLTNMYDGARNPQRFPTKSPNGERDMNLFETAVIDAGFDGYYIENGFGRQGSAVMLGDATRAVSPDGSLKQTARKFGAEITAAYIDMAKAEGVFTYPKVNGATFEATLHGMDENSALLEVSRPAIIGSGRTRITIRNRKTGHNSYLVENARNEIWLDLSELKSKHDFGSAIYAATADYAYYHNKVFIGDPAGLSDVALFRRTENMLAMALKYGTTKHLAPHLKQTDPRFFHDQYGYGKFADDAQALRWVEGDDEFNIASLAFTGYTNLRKLIPEIADATWNPQTGNFEWLDGRPFDADAVARHSTVRALKENGYGDLVSRTQDVDGTRRESSPIGSRTLKRGLITQTILQGQSLEERGSILSALSDRVRRSSVPTGHDEFSGILYQTPREQWYFSTLAESISKAKQDSMPADQWSAWLNSNAPNLGIKKEEIFWTGINEWLALQSGKVSKGDIQAYLAGNGVLVKETLLETKNVEDIYKIYVNADNEYDVVDTSRPFADGSMRTLYTSTDRLDAQEYVDTLAGSIKSDTKYSDYTVDGGTNYKELLLTLPENSQERDKAIADIVAYKEELFAKYLTDEEKANGDFKLSLVTQRYTAEEDLMLDALLDAKNSTGSTAPYKSNHWEQPNILAHIRFDERRDADGKKVLYIQEIQSDWGQEGKKKGFIERYKPKDVKPLAPTDIEASQPELFWYFKVPDNTLQIPKTRFATEAEALNYILTEKQTVTGATTPKAPFVTDTKAWVGLALKRVMSYAVENGFDRVAFINGQQAAGLYDLSKQVDTIRAFKRPEGSYYITADGKEIAPEVTEKELENYVGKDLALKIVNGDNKHPDGFQEFSGVDLKVGGEGMRMFYDQIVPWAAKDVLKKLGSSLDKADISMGKGVIDGMPTIGNTYSEQLSFTITPEMKEQVAKGLPLFQKALGEFRPENLAIALLEGADFSTAIHEGSHGYFEILQRMSTGATPVLKLRSDFLKALEWFGIDEDAWLGMSLDQQRPYLEQWAESWELWTLEGKAPSLALQPLFSRYRAWMISVYNSIEAFLVTHPSAGKLNDEVRAIFGRLVATEDAILEAERIRGYQPLYKTAEEAGVSPSEFEEYLAQGDQATLAATDALSARSLRDMKWLNNAQSKALKELQATANSEREAIRKEVTDEVMAEPINLVRTFFRTGEVEDPTSGDTIKLTEGFKLDKGALAAMYPKTALDTPDLTALRGMTTDKGLHPDIVAKMFGLPSGDALVRELIGGEPAKDKIDGLTEQRMLEEHGELVDPTAIQRAAEEAIHNKARARFMATGLKMLLNTPVSAYQLGKAARESALNTISAKRVKDIRPKQFLAAEKKANKEVFSLLAKDPQGAQRAQREALLNNHLAIASEEAQKEVDAALKYLAKFDKEGTRKNISLDYVGQIDALLEPFDLRKSTPVATLSEWVAQQEALGFEPNIDVEAIAKISKRPYKTLTMEELRGLMDTIKQIEHMGRLEKKLLTAKARAEFAERVEEARLSIALNAGKAKKRHPTPNDAVGVLAQWGRLMAASHRKFSSFLLQLDGGKDNGVMFNLFLAPGTDAANAETEALGKSAEAVNRLFEPIMGELNKGFMLGNFVAVRKVVPGTRHSMTHEERIMFVMNYGNAGNRQRLLDGGNSSAPVYSEADARAIIDTLSKKELEFVQGVWDHITTFRPEIEALERDLTGKTPAWVEPSPFGTKYGTMRGGYFPAKYDVILSTTAAKKEAQTNIKMAMKAAYGAAATRKGFVEARAEEVKGRPLLLSFSAISSHTNEVIHRLAWQRWLVDAGRLVNALDNDIRDHLGVEGLDEIRKLLDDIASGGQGPKNATERMMAHARKGTTIVGLGWRLTTALLQPTGLAISWSKLGSASMAKGLSQYLSNPIETAAWVESKSLFMKNRASTRERDVNDIVKGVRAGKKITRFQSSFFYLIAMAQRTVDVPTYLGAYDKYTKELHLEQAATPAERADMEEQAHRLAAQAVKETQGAGELFDQAGVQRGTELVKLFTVFFSYMNTVYNKNVNNFRATHFDSPEEVGKFIANFILINIVPAVMSVALKNMLKGTCEWGDTECLLVRYNAEQVGYLLGQMVGLRELSSVSDIVTGGKTYGYSGPAGARLAPEVIKLVQQLEQGDMDGALAKSANTVAGTLLHYPAGQINSTVAGAIAAQETDAEGLETLQLLISGPKN